MQPYFVDIKDIDNYFEVTEVMDKPLLLYEYMLFNNVDIIYALEGEKLAAIVSVGDLFRYYTGANDKFELNPNFSFVSGIDFKKAEKIFERIHTIYEVPVIENGKFIGVIRNGKERTQGEWEDIHSYLKRAADIKKRTKFLIEEVNRWKTQTEDIELFIYANVDKNIDAYLTEEGKRQYKEKIKSILSADYTNVKWKKENGYNIECFNIRAIQEKGCYFYEDYQSNSMNITDRHRITPNADEHIHKIFLVGPCTILGVCVNDEETIGYYLQELINKEHYLYEVVNCGLMGPGYESQGLFVEKMSKGDKVVLCLNSDYYCIDAIKRSFQKEYKGSLSKVFELLSDPINCWVDSPAHCKEVVNKHLAECIWNNLEKEGIWLKEDKELGERKALQNYYLHYEVFDYFEKYIERYQALISKNGVIGAIVMNCNPFTKGHRYLIENALKQVDLLYVFVVEEDKSYYSFEDRFEMVKRGVVDLENVKVLPSGKFILSRETFAQYFDKESIREVEDMSYDIRIFGEIVAKKLGVTYRFIGEEPKDVVTREYNETMKAILPEYGIEVVEFARLSIGDGDEVVSATTVRRLVEEGNFMEISRYCPESTVKYLLKEKNEEKNNCNYSRL